MSDVATEHTQLNHKANGQFAKGHTIRGNPGGRPKTALIRREVDKWTPEFLKELYRQATTSGSEKSRREAIEMLWNRAYGKPVAPVAIAGAIQQHFVLRAPTPLPDAEAWEAKYGAALPIEKTMDGSYVVPSQPAADPVSEPHPVYENPAIPLPERTPLAVRSAGTYWDCCVACRARPW